MWRSACPTGPRTRSSPTSAGWAWPRPRPPDVARAGPDDRFGEPVAAVVEFTGGNKGSRTDRRDDLCLTARRTLTAHAGGNAAGPWLADRAVGRVSRCPPRRPHR